LAFLEGGSPARLFQVPNDLAVYVVDTSTGNIVATFDDDNLNTDMAFELVDFTNATQSSQFALSFQLKSGPAPSRLAWVGLGSPVDPPAQGEGAPTMFGQAAAAGALAIGAVDQAAPAEAGFATALGGDLEVLFDAQGNRLASPELRHKPDL